MFVKDDFFEITKKFAWVFWLRRCKINYLRLDSHTSEHVGDYMNQMQFQQQPMQVMQPPQQEELQTVTHKKVVVRTIQTRDGQVSKVISSPIGYIFV